METPPNEAKLLVLEDQTLTRLADHPELQKLVPSLRRVREVRDRMGAAGCTSCARNRLRAELVAGLQAAKAAIAGLPPDSKIRLREVLGARRVRLVYRDGAKIRELTF